MESINGKAKSELFERALYQQALEQAAVQCGFSIDPVKLEQSLNYIDLLLDWNQNINLTAITDPEGVAVRHFADSWSLCGWLDRLASGLRRPLRMIDVGTGAGFPGLPLQIMRPQTELVLLDSLQKRVRFLQTVVDHLMLPNVHCLHGRAEEAARIPDLRESFDLSVARAVAALPVLCEYCLPFVRPGGYFIAMKAHAQEEVQTSASAIEKLGGRFLAVETIHLPDSDLCRNLVVIEKIKPTPRVFPRKAGKPQKEPL